MGATCGRACQVHGQGQFRCAALSRFQPGGGGLADERPQRGRSGGRHLVARSRAFQGVQGALPLAAVRPMGSGECSKSGQSAPLRSNARRRVGEGEGGDWRSCKAHCAGVRCMLMAVERTFSIIKPDATARNITGAINTMLEQAGLRIIAQKRVRISRDQAETFYAVHRQRPFFRELVEFMISGPVVVQVLEGENAIARYRDIMGATDPAKAAPGTVRKVHAKSIGENSVHGSDAPETAAVEIAQFFSGNEIVG